MSIFHIKKRENPFVMVDKGFIHDVRLSFKAKGILLYLLSKPDDWRVYESEIAKHSADGLKAVRSGVKELLVIGYLSRQRIRVDNKWAGYEYEVYEQPVNPIKTTVMPFWENGKRHTTNNDKTELSICLVSAGKIGKQEKLIPHNKEQLDKLNSALSSASQGRASH